MVRATDLLFGKIVVRNQLATEILVRDCLQALAGEADRGTTLGDVMVRKGLILPADAEKARHAAALAQAQRYLKFAQEMQLIAAEAGQQAVEELRRRSYRGGIGRVLLDMGMPRQIHESIVSRDPKTLDDSDGAPPASGAPAAPPAHPQAPVGHASQAMSAQQQAPPQQHHPQPPPAPYPHQHQHQQAHQQHHQQPGQASQAMAHGPGHGSQAMAPPGQGQMGAGAGSQHAQAGAYGAPGHASQAVAAPPLPGAGLGSQAMPIPPPNATSHGHGSQAMQAPYTGSQAMAKPGAPPQPPPGSGWPPAAHQQQQQQQQPPAPQGWPPSQQPSPPQHQHQQQHPQQQHQQQQQQAPQPGPEPPALPGWAEPPPGNEPVIEFTSTPAPFSLRPPASQQGAQGAPQGPGPAPHAPHTDVATARAPVPSPHGQQHQHQHQQQQQQPRASGEGVTLPLPPGTPVPPGSLHGTSRELVAVALRDGIATKAEVDAILASGPPQVYNDARALADCLVQARVLARPQTDLISAFVTIEREAPSIEVEGFYLIAPLGFGIYGPVFMARRIGGPKPNETTDLALEVMPLSIARDPRRNDEFRRNCGYLPTVEHPALVRAVEAGQTNNLTFLARESPPGISLAERLAKKVLPEKDALDLGRAVVDALGALALSQLAHGAVRPENIVLTPDGRWILRHIGSTPAPIEWDPEAQPPCADVPRWLSPEAISGAPPSPKSDMYSLGCVLFAAVTGRAPYDGASSAAIIAQHWQGRLPDPSTFGVQLSERFFGMLTVLCNPDPSRRYGDFVEVLEELETIRAGGAGQGADPESTLLYKNTGGGAPLVGPGAAGGSEDSNDRTMVGSADEDADLKEMRRLAAERRKQKAAEAAGLGGVGEASGAAPQPGQKGADPLVGIVLSGRYRLVKKVGSGGMGTVYLAEHLLLHRNVALKILHPKLLENQEAIQRFDREVKASSRFQHPGVVHIFDAGEDVAANGTKLHYMVMEFVEGEDLHKIVEREGALPIPRACKIFRQVLPAMDEAHKKGIVHRDMKTDNIMVMKGPAGDDIAKIMDFGIAKIIEGQESTNTGLHGQQQFKTRKGVVTGTPQYMSPEQASGDPNVDGRSDLYSFGIIMYEMVLGELPFKSNTAMGYLGKHIVEPPIPMKEARPDIDVGADLDRVIMKCLEKQRDQRWQTGAEILRDLEETVFPPFLGTPIPEGARRRSSGGAGKKLLKAIVFLFVMGVLGAGGFFGWGWWQGRRLAARANAIRAAGELVAKGDVAGAKEKLALVGDESDPAVQAVRKQIEVVEAQRRRGDSQNTLFSEAEKLLSNDKLDEAEAKVREAAKIGPDDRGWKLLEAIDKKRKKARAAKLVSEGDALEKQSDDAGAKAKYEAAVELGLADDEVLKKLSRARARIAGREARALQEAGDFPGGAEKYREALRALGPDDGEANELDEKLRGLLTTYDGTLAKSAEDRKAYFDALLAKADEYDKRKDFRSAQRYYKDARIFCPDARGGEMSRTLQEAADRTEEQRKFEEARDTSRKTRAMAKVGAYERTFAVELLEQYILRYSGVDSAGHAKGNFVEAATEELKLLKASTGTGAGTGKTQ